MHRIGFTTALLLSMLPAIATAQDTATRDNWTTRSGDYVVSYTSELTPIDINQIHRWVVHVEFPDGTPVTDATISITGGMPEHNHGLPTEPRMTESLGDGNYVLQGMRFHMNGYWELTLTVIANGTRDTVLLSLTI